MAENYNNVDIKGISPANVNKIFIFSANFLKICFGNIKIVYNINKAHANANDYYLRQGEINCEKKLP